MKRFDMTISNETTQKKRFKLYFGYIYIYIYIIHSQSHVIKQQNGNRYIYIINIKKNP